MCCFKRTHLKHVLFKVLRTLKYEMGFLKKKSPSKNWRKLLTPCPKVVVPFWAVSMHQRCPIVPDRGFVFQQLFCYSVLYLSKNRLLWPQLHQPQDQNALTHYSPMEVHSFQVGRLFTAASMWGTAFCCNAGITCIKSFSLYFYHAWVH